MRILIISQYPIHPAVHGGQKRTSAIVSYYKQKNDVKHCAVYWPGMYQEPVRADDSYHFIVASEYLINQLRLHPERSDLLLGRSLSGRSKLGQRLRDLIVTFKPDMIHVEQPYLILPLRSILNGIDYTAVIVHGSQNVEHSLKRDIYNKILPKNDFNYLIESTTRVERLAIKQSDINIGVSRADIGALRQYIGQIWLVAGNGTDAISKVQSITDKGDLDSTLVFVGSAHPPNYMGVESLLKDTRFLVDKSRLLLIGGVAEYFQSKYSESDPFWLGKVFVGKVDDKELKRYIQHSDIIVLPIETGGGSNLKTAEAIGAHKRIIGTSFAFRGYEDYKGLPNVFIANTAEEFKDTILQALAMELQPYTDAQLRLVNRLRWRCALRSLTVAIFYTRIILFVKRIRRHVT